MNERELIVAYILRYAARHDDIRRAALEVVAERIQAGDHERVTLADLDDATKRIAKSVYEGDRYLLVHPDGEKMRLNLPNRYKR